MATIDYENKAGIALAEYKLGLVSPALNGTFPDPTMAAYFRRIASEPLGLPDGSRVRVRPATLAGWRRAYLAGGFEALMPKRRSDLGTSRRIDAELAADIQAIRAESPRMSAAMLHERLVADGLVGEGELSVATVQRFFRRNPAPAAGAQAKDRRAFESPRVNGIWQADTLHGPYVGEPARRAYLQAVIDDKSRKIVAARFVGRDCAATFQGTLRMAVASHGVPEKLFVDNGGPYRNDQLSMICGGLGIVLCHAAVRDGAAKGKIERWNRTVRMRFLSALPERASGGLDELNAALAKWVASYNSSPHSSTGKAPSEAFAAEADRLKWPEGGEGGLDDAFRNRITRKVANDATVRVDGVLYDAPMGLVGEKVELRFTPGRPDDVWLHAEGAEPVRVAPTDKAANASAPRVRPAYVIDFAARGGE